MTLASATFFIFGGIGLITVLLEQVLIWTGVANTAVEHEPGFVIFEVVEFVHTFLVGTVLYITAVGLFQLFISDVDFPAWLKIENTEELETNLISVTVVVLAVNFMGATFDKNTTDLFQYGTGIALPIAAL